MADVSASIVEALLEGMPLPARRDEIVEHAEVEGAEEEMLAALRALPDREYDTADDIGEALRPAYAPTPGPESPRESGEPPGGRSYTA